MRYAAENEFHLRPRGTWFFGLSLRQTKKVPTGTFLVWRREIVDENPAFPVNRRFQRAADLRQVFPSDTCAPSVPAPLVISASAVIVGCRHPHPRPKLELIWQNPLRSCSVCRLLFSCEGQRARSKSFECRPARHNTEAL